MYNPERLKWNWLLKDWELIDNIIKKNRDFLNMNEGIRYAQKMNDKILTKAGYFQYE